MQRNQQQTQIQQFTSCFPAVQISIKSYGLQADMISGWRPRMKVLGPIPFNFDNRVVDDVVDQLTTFGRRYDMRVTYLGYRYQSSFKLQTQIEKDYKFKHQAIANGNFSHMAAYFRKFHANFKSKITRIFKGMNPTLKKDQQPIFDSNFQSGNLDAVIKLGQKQYDLFLRVDTNTRGHIQWFNFKIKNNGLKSIKINIVNFRKYKTLYQRGLKPYIYSECLKQTKGLGWHQGGQNVKYQRKKLRYTFLEEYYLEEALMFDCLQFEYKFQNQWEQVQFAYCPPFTYSDNLQMIKQLKKLSFSASDRQRAKNNQEIQQQSLGQSLGGLDIPLLTITDPQIDNKKKKCMLISGRIHPGQTNGSYMLKGFLQFICGNTLQAQLLRKLVIFKVIPMINPDGVTVGNFRTSFCGKDLNRTFRSNVDLLIPQVKALKQLVLKLKRQYRNRLIFFLDFHGHSVKKNVFIYGPQYQIWENNYYRTRIFPKLISCATEMFRYYSCVFRVADFKKTTARAIILRNIPHCYTIQASIGFFYSVEHKKDIQFTIITWKQMGKKIGQSIKQYMQLIYDDQITKQERKQKINDLKGFRPSYKQSEQNLKYTRKNSLVNKVPSRVYSNTKNNIQNNKSINEDQQKFIFQEDLHNLSLKARQLIDLIKKDEACYNLRKLPVLQKQLEGNQIQNQYFDNQSDNFSEGGSDSQGQEDDIPASQLDALHNQIIISINQFQDYFYTQSQTIKNKVQFKKKPLRQMETPVHIRLKRQSKGIQMIASLRKRAQQLQKTKQDVVFPRKLKRSSQFTPNGNSGPKSNIFPQYQKINYKSFIDQLNFDQRKSKDLNKSQDAAKNFKKQRQNIGNIRAHSGEIFKNQND